MGTKQIRKRTLRTRTFKRKSLSRGGAYGDSRASGANTKANALTQKQNKALNALRKANFNLQSTKISTLEEVTKAINDPATTHEQKMALYMLADYHITLLNRDKARYEEYTAFLPQVHVTPEKLQNAKNKIKDINENQLIINGK